MVVRSSCIPPVRTVPHGGQITVHSTSQHSGQITMHSTSQHSGQIIVHSTSQHSAIQWSDHHAFHQSAQWSDHHAFHQSTQWSDHHAFHQSAQCHTVVRPKACCSCKCGRLDLETDPSAGSLLLGLGCSPLLSNKNLKQNDC